MSRTIILVTGQVGAGMPEVGNELANRGYDVIYNRDFLVPGLRSDDVYAGAPVSSIWAETEQPTVDWARLEELLEQTSDDGFVFVVGVFWQLFGMSPSGAEPLFDQVFALEVSKETLRSNLSDPAFTPSPDWNTSELHDRLVDNLPAIQSMFVEHAGAVMVDANRSIPEIVDDIETQLGAKVAG